MALSEDAKGIIAEIRSQANTTRHKSEQYSLKAIRADLSKFQGVFDAMNANLSLMTGNAEAAADAAARQAALAQLSEDERAKLARDAASREKRENDLKNRDLKLREKEMKKREKSDFKIFGKDGILGNMFGGAMGLVKKALFIGIGGSILYELTAGFLERFGVDLPPIADVAKKFGDLATSVDWEELKKNLNELTAADFKGLAGTIALGVAATKVGPAVGGALELAKDVTILGLLRKMITPDADDVDAAGKEGDKSGKISGKRMAARGLRLGIAGLVFTGLSSVMPAMEKMFREYALGMTEDEMSKVRVDGVDIAGNAITSLAGLLVPGGPIIKLVATAGIFAFKTLGDYLEDAADKDLLTNDIKDLETKRSEMDSKLDRLIKLKTQLLNAGKDPSLIEDEIAELERQLEEITGFNAKEDYVKALAKRADRLAQLKAAAAADSPENYKTTTVAELGMDKDLPLLSRLGYMMAAGDSAMAGAVEMPVSDQEAAAAWAAAEERRKTEIAFLEASIEAIQKQALEKHALTLATKTSAQLQAELGRPNPTKSEMRLIDAFNKELREDESRAMELLVQGEAKSMQEVLKRLGAYDPFSHINLVLNAPNNSQLSFDGSQRTAFQNSTTKYGDGLNAPSDHALGGHVNQ